MSEKTIELLAIIVVAVFGLIILLCFLYFLRILYRAMAYRFGDEYARDKADAGWMEKQRAVLSGMDFEKQKTLFSMLVSKGEIKTVKKPIPPEKEKYLNMLHPDLAAFFREYPEVSTGGGCLRIGIDELEIFDASAFRLAETLKRDDVFVKLGTVDEENILCADVTAGRPFVCFAWTDEFQFSVDAETIYSFLLEEYVSQFIENSVRPLPENPFDI